MFDIVPNKALILTGRAAVGKTLIQRFIAEGHLAENVVTLNGREKMLMSNPFVFDKVTPSTTLILVDDVINPKIFDFFKQFIPRGIIKVEKKGKYPIEVSTDNIQFVFSTDLSFEKIALTNATNRRYHVIELNQCNHNPLKRDEQPG